MNAPWMGNMPGWREQGFWQYEDPEMDALGQQAVPGGVRERRRAQRHLPPDDPEGARGAGAHLAGQRAQHLPGHGRAGRRHRGRLGRPAVTVDPPVGARARARTRSRSATCGSGPSAPPGTRSAASATSTAATSGATCIDPPHRQPPVHGRAQPFRANYEVKTAGPDGQAGRARRRRRLGRRDATSGSPVAGAPRRPARSPSTTPSTSAVPLARRPAHHPRRRRLLHRPGLRPRLRRRTRRQSRSPSRRRRGRTWTPSRASA